jgi:hypothetical protein
MALDTQAHLRVTFMFSASFYHSKESAAYLRSSSRQKPNRHVRLRCTSAATARMSELWPPSPDSVNCELMLLPLLIDV